MRLGLLIRRWRSTSDLTVRAVAQSIGVSTATLSRIERGESCDSSTLIRVIGWALQDVNVAEGQISNLSNLSNRKARAAIL